jgi:hypothetical protein
MDYGDYEDYGMGGYEYGDEEEYGEKDSDDLDYGEERSEEEEESEGPEIISEGEEGEEYGTTFKDLERMGFGATTGGGKKRMEKMIKTPLERYLDDIYAILSRTYYVNENERNAVVEMITHVPHVERLNPDVIIAACIWKLRKYQLTKKVFNDFVKRIETSEVSAIDLLRYIRILSK